MIKIDDSYDIVLTYSPIIEITGHIFECFDYYLFLRNKYKVGILFFAGLNLQLLRVAWESKYCVPFDTVINDLIQIPPDTISKSKQLYVFGKNTIVIVADGNLKSLEHNNIVLVTTHLLGFRCALENLLSYTNSKITYLQDFRIYGKHQLVPSINYVKKIPFKYYKPSTSPNSNIGLIYMTYVCRKVSPDIIEKYHRMSKCSHTLLVVPYKLPEYDEIPGITQVTAPVENLFDKFDTYIYTPINRKFDCSPRLVTECFFHHKYVFKHLDYNDIGLETRYTDCITNIESLNLTDNDQILTIIEQLKNK